MFYIPWGPCASRLYSRSSRSQAPASSPALLSSIIGGSRRPRANTPYQTTCPRLISWVWTRNSVCSKEHVLQGFVDRWSAFMKVMELYQQTRSIPKQKKTFPETWFTPVCTIVLIYQWFGCYIGNYLSKIKQLSESLAGKFPITMLHPHLGDERRKFLVTIRHLGCQGCQSSMQP